MGNKQSSSSKYEGNDDPVLIKSHVRDQRKFFPSLQEIPTSCQIGSEFDPNSQDFYRGRRTSSFSHLAFQMNGKRRGLFVCDEYRNLDPEVKSCFAVGYAHGKVPRSDSGYNTFCVTDSERCEKSRSWLSLSTCNDDKKILPAGLKRQADPSKLFQLCTGIGAASPRFSAQAEYPTGKPPHLPTLTPPVSYSNPTQLPSTFLLQQALAESKTEKIRKKERRQCGKKSTVDIHGDLSPGILFSPTWPRADTFSTTVPIHGHSRRHKAKSIENLRMGIPTPVVTTCAPSLWMPVCSAETIRKLPGANNSRLSYHGLHTSFQDEKADKSSGQASFQRQKKRSNGISLKSIEKKSSASEPIFVSFNKSKKYKRKHKRCTDENRRESRKFEDKVSENIPNVEHPVLPKTEIWRHTPPPDVIYETLKAARRSLFLTTADLELSKNREIKENFLDLSQENMEPMVARKPSDRSQRGKLSKEILHHQTGITKATVENGAKVIDHLDHSPKLSNERPTNDFGRPALAEKLITELNDGDESLHHRAASTVADQLDDEVENFISAMIGSYLPKPKSPRSEHFDPLISWHALNQSTLSNTYECWNRSQNTSRTEVNAIEGEQLTLKLITAAPPRRGVSSLDSESIYVEYEQRLPEFKKRLIETGTFDVDQTFDKNRFESNKPSMRNERGCRLSDSLSTRMESSNFCLVQTEKKNLVNATCCRKWNLTRSREKNVAKPIYMPKSTCREEVNVIKNTDGSDIDFGWVNDLENSRERREFVKESGSNLREIEPLQIQQDGSYGDCVPCENESIMLQSWSSSKQLNCSLGHLPVRYFGHSPNSSIHSNNRHKKQDQAQISEHLLTKEMPPSEVKVGLSVKEKLAIFEQEAIRLQKDSQANQKQQKKTNRTLSLPFLIQLFNA